MSGCTFSSSSSCGSLSIDIPFGSTATTVLVESNNGQRQHNAGASRRKKSIEIRVYLGVSCPRHPYVELWQQRCPLRLDLLVRDFSSRPCPLTHCDGMVSHYQYSTEGRAHLFIRQFRYSLDRTRQAVDVLEFLRRQSR